MSATHFINTKGPQLAAYVNAFLGQQLAHKELEGYLWETLEEWSELDVCPEGLSGERERVFWHLFCELKTWPEQQLLGNEFLRDQLIHCSQFLGGEAKLPPFCTGVRP